MIDPDTRDQPIPAAELLPPRGRLRGWQVTLGLAGLAAIFGAGLLADGEFGAIVTAGLETSAFAVLALLAYLGLHRRRWRALAITYLLFLIGGAAVFTVLIGANLIFGMPDPDTPPDLTAEQAVQFLALIGGTGVAGLLGLLAFVPAVRRGVARWLPVDPESSVHTIALAAVVALTFIPLVPLAVLGEPPLLRLIAEGGAGARDDAGQLRDTLYAAIWLVPASFVAVGWGIERTWRVSLLRLGLIRPTLRQVLAGAAWAVLLVAAVQGLEFVIDAVWTAAGWPRTDESALDELFAFAATPLGAVVVGVTAGLGEELGVRGILQPRLGIVLSNLFFTSLHAFQYNVDGLLVVFALGLVLGVIRARSNTTVSAIAHGGYDFLLLLAIAAGVM